MPLLRRMTALLLAAVLGLGVLLTGPVASSSAAARPAITAVGTGSGPVKATEITVRGTNLKGAKEIRFGKKKGKIVKVVDATTLRVRTPKGVKAGKVSVTVKTRAGWSKKTAAATYTFVKAPTLSRLSATKGTFAGGQRVSLTGKNLKKTQQVLVGGVAAKVLSRANKKLVVLTPAGVVGRTTVKVVSPGGTSKGRPFTYVLPPTKHVSTVVPKAGTAAPSKVDWVTGGQSETGSSTEPWLVGLPAGASVPEIGQKFVVRPGASAFPSGLAGTVSDVAVQADDTVRVTVAPTDLSSVLDRLAIDYDGPVAVPDTTASGRGRDRREVSQGANFAVKGPTALFCKDDEGQEVKFGADLSLTVTDIDVSQHLDLGGLVRRPTYDGAVTAELETTGKISVEAAATCKLWPTWQNAQRRIIPLGTTGATLSFGPTVELKIAAKGTYSLKDRTRTTFAVNAEYGKRPTYSRTARTVESKHSGALSFEAEVTAGVSMQLGILDRAGLEGKLQLGVSASVTATTSNVCVDGKLFFKMSIGVFLDAWVARWEGEAFSATLDIASIHQCARPESSAPAGEPEITSARLPDASIGSYYTTRLTTADNRAGRWSLVRGSLPEGIVLNPDDGTISGTPQGPIGDAAVIVDFTDADAKVATTTIRLLVRPSAGLGGGNIQVTLKWSSGADLDLHVFDPANEEIWYRNRESASGGVLDHDANAACRDTGDGDNPVENVYWPPNGAPTGTYGAAVRVYDPCGASLDWHLVVRRNGVVVVDKTGTGDSPVFSFGVGQGSGARLAERNVLTSSAPK